MGLTPVMKVESRREAACRHRRVVLDQVVISTGNDGAAARCRGLVVASGSGRSREDRVGQLHRGRPVTGAGVAHDEEGAASVGGVIVKGGVDDGDGSAAGEDGSAVRTNAGRVPAWPPPPAPPAPPMAEFPSRVLFVMASCPPSLKMAPPRPRPPRHHHSPPRPRAPPLPAQSRRHHRPSCRQGGQLHRRRRRNRRCRRQRRRSRCGRRRRHQR